MTANIQRTRAQESRAAIERIYIAMRHLFIRGSYKPMGVSGAMLRNSLITLSPEIYGSIADENKVELNGLLYVLERLPKGIEECRYVRLVSREGLRKSKFKPIIPPKRVRNCYRIDKEQIMIEMTRGRSDIYDILTHLTFVYNEAEKIRRNALDYRDRLQHDWLKLEKIISKEDKKGSTISEDEAFTYLSSLLGRSYAEVQEMSRKFDKKKKTANNLFHVVYWLGKRAIDEFLEERDREITFSPLLRERVGHHIYGDKWANTIKQTLVERKIFRRPIHVISANPHSILNSLYGKAALKKSVDTKSLLAIVKAIAGDKTGRLQKKVKDYAEKNGMVQLDDMTGTNLTVQIFDVEKLDISKLPREISVDKAFINKVKPVLVVMDYAFGEQAYETMDELLKPMVWEGQSYPINITSVSVMGKAGILNGKKGDIMIPTAHVFEGTADNYPFRTDLRIADFEGHGLKIYRGPMVTVLGTSLQNREILKYFMDSSWNAIGLEMEGAHYQKAIQSAAQIRKSISSRVRVRYAYYASDNPVVTGHTLASGSLGMEGVKPTYLISSRILEKILNP